MRGAIPAQVKLMDTTRSVPVDSVVRLPLHKGFMLKSSMSFPLFCHFTPYLRFLNS